MTTESKGTLTRWERKERLGHGGVQRIADIAGVDQALVSRVLNGRQRHEKIEQLITAAIGRPGEQVFPPRVADPAA
jgi:transcriptional regulator with XRE-family HTH domain